MGAPQTLPSDFAQWDKAPATLPANFDQWDQSKTTQASVGQRLRQNFAEGLGVTDDEGAKNFFTHPIDTLMKSLDAQGQLAVKAKQAYQSGDYKGALMYGLNYLAPFIGQQTAKAGEQLNQGDIAGGIARTAGAAVPLVAGSPEGRAGLPATRGVVSDAASAVASVAKPAAGAVAERLPEIAGGAAGAYLGHATGIPEGGLIGAIAGRGLAKSVVERLGRLSDALEKSQAAHADVADMDATAENKPYAGETARGMKLSAQATAPAAQASPAPPTEAVQPAAQASPAPRTVVTDPATGVPEFSDVIAAKQAGPQFADRPRIVPAVQNIRERIAQVNDAEAQPNRPTADSLEDKGLQQEMNWDLERHGWAADSEARREFIARNSTGVTKAELTGAVEKPVRYTKTPGVPSIGITDADDLTDILQKSLAAARQAQAKQ